MEWFPRFFAVSGLVSPRPPSSLVLLSLRCFCPPVVSPSFSPFFFFYRGLWVTIHLFPSLCHQNASLLFCPPIATPTLLRRSHQKARPPSWTQPFALPFFTVVSLPLFRFRSLSTPVACECTRIRKKRTRVLSPSSLFLLSHARSPSHNSHLRLRAYSVTVDGELRDALPAQQSPAYSSFFVSFPSVRAAFLACQVCGVLQLRSFLCFCVSSPTLSVLVFVCRAFARFPFFLLFLPCRLPPSAFRLSLPSLPSHTPSVRQIRAHRVTSPPPCTFACVCSFFSSPPPPSLSECVCVALIRFSCAPFVIPFLDCVSVPVHYRCSSPLLSPSSSSTFSASHIGYPFRSCRSAFEFVCPGVFALLSGHRRLSCGELGARFLAWLFSFLLFRVSLPSLAILGPAAAQRVWQQQPTTSTPSPFLTPVSWTALVYHHFLSTAAPLTVLSSPRTLLCSSARSPLLVAPPPPPPFLVSVLVVQPRLVCVRSSACVCGCVH